MRLKAIPMEIIGTFALVYFGGLSLILFDLGQLSVTGVALSHGFIYTIMIWMGDHLSGGYFNPALTLGDMAIQRISLIRGLYIICAQICGSFLAASYLTFAMDFKIINLIQNKSILGYPTLNKSIGFTQSQGLLAELIGSFFLQFVSLMARNRAPYRKDYYAFCIGITVSAVIMAIGNICGGALNPARVLGPMFLTQRAVETQAIYMLGPTIGALLGSLFFNSFFKRQEKKTKTKKKKST